MIPNKLNHGENIASLFEKFNALIDYLRQIRLVAGSGIRLNKLVTGITIESTAQSSGGGMTAPSSAAHPFDAEIVNNGTEENPSYYVRIYNSALPDSPYAGMVYIGEFDEAVPVEELAVTTDGGFFVYLSIDYIQNSNPNYSIQFELIPYGSGSPQADYYLVIAEGKLPDVVSRQESDITVLGRWA